ncbi:MAG TPA: inverse autotransporter beta domain-containing protein [Planctomicrobium sp.]|nr:inverse autotransporter beta domain-containing protein [Planctomicrobium sp.]
MFRPTVCWLHNQGVSSLILIGLHSSLVLMAGLGLFRLGESTSQADDDMGQLAFPDPEPDPEPSSRRSNTGNGYHRPFSTQKQAASGIDGRIGIIGLPTLGRDESIIPLELFPYVQSENQILFGDIRAFLATNGKPGVNVGMGYRFIEPNEIALFGVNAFYDADGTLGEFFHQLSVGWEARTEMFGAFGNFYFPVGARNQTLSQTVYNERFEQNRILFDVRSRTGDSMSGLDLNLQMFLPGDFARDHQIQATAGWYTLAADGVENINGFQMQLQGDIHPRVTLLSSLTSDKTFGTNVTIGGLFNFGSQARPDTTLQGQLRRPVNRNYNVIVSTKSVAESDVVAVNKATGNEYVVQHVGTATGAESGTYDQPYESISDAQAAGADIIFVHSGTTVNEAVVLNNGQSLIGEGATVTLRDARYGNFRVPNANTGGASSPTIDGSGIFGDLIQLASDSRISGFLIQNSQGHGVVANGIENFVIHDVTIENSTGSAVYIAGSADGDIDNIRINGGTTGIHLVEIDESLELSNIYVNGVSNSGVLIDGGYGEIAFTDELIIQNAGQYAFYVTNLKTLVEVDDKGTVSISDDVTTETPALVTVAELVVRNNTGGTGIHLENNEGIIAFGAVDIETQNAAAFSANNTENAQILNGYLTSINSAAVHVENSGINVALTQLNVNGGVHGLEFIETSGSFTVYGSGNLGSGGAIQGTTAAIFMENGPLVALQTVDFTSNGKVAEIDGADGLILYGSNITQTADMFIDATNLTMLQISDSQFTNNTIASGTGIWLCVDELGSFTSSVTYNTVDSVPGTFFRTETVAGGEGSSLAYNFQGNDVGITGPSAVAAAVNWTGPTTAYFLDNVITGTNSGQVGIQFKTGASNDQALVQIAQNAVTLNGANSVGIDVDTSSMSTIYVTSNGVLFNALNGTGVRINLRDAGGANVTGNYIVDQSGGATGILFENIEHLSTLVIETNTIDLSYASTFVDRGIVLSSILNPDGVDDPFVTLISTSSNTVTGATTNYSLPATGTRGTLMINGVFVQ